MSGRKSVLIAIAVFVSFASFSVSAAAEPSVPADEDFYVQDFAGVISEETREQITAYNIILESQCDGAQLVVTTVSDLHEDIERFADRLFAEWCVGSAENGNGMLFVVDTDSGQRSLRVGDGLRDAFTEESEKEYLDRFFPITAGENVDDAIATLTAALYDWFLDYYGVADAGGIGQASVPEIRTDLLIDDDAASARAPVPPLLRFISLLIILSVVWTVVSALRFFYLRRRGDHVSFRRLLLFGRR